MEISNEVFFMSHHQEIDLHISKIAIIVMCKKYKMAVTTKCKMIYCKKYLNAVTFGLSLKFYETKILYTW